MPTSYLAPGVYVEETPSESHVIAGVGTSTAAFIGNAPLTDARVNEAVPVDNWSQFLKYFYKEGCHSSPLSNAVYGYFQNGGRRCYVVNLGGAESLTGIGKTRAGVDVLETVEEVKIVAAPGFSGAKYFDPILTHCENMRNRFAIMDGPETVKNIDALTKVGTASATKDEDDKPAAGRAGSSEEEAGYKPRLSAYGAFYHPWITVRDPLCDGKLVNVPPSGHIAGIYARSDANRGVHKAPANEVIRGALGVESPLSRADQEVLNPNGVNCIVLAREGVLCWGARTVGPPDWVYVNVRRLFNFIEESIGLGTRWMVFEPNDSSLWQKMKRDVSQFLTVLWRDGALMGKTREQAFFIQCDEETNPPEIIDRGMVVMRIGIAPVKPAEFVVFRIGQSASGTKVEAE